MRKEERKRKGFTLAELLIVVAIIAVLVAISIPIFNKQLEKSREATDLANVRSAYAKIRTVAMTGETDSTDVKKRGTGYEITVPLKQKQDDWQTPGTLNVGGITSDDTIHWTGKPKADGTCRITVAEDGETVIYWDAGLINMQVANPKYAVPVNTVLNILKNGIVNPLLANNNQHVSMVLIVNGKVTKAYYYSSATDKVGNNNCNLTTDQQDQLNDEIKTSLSEQGYKLTTTTARRVYFDYEGNVVSGLKEDGKPIGIAGQGVNAQLSFSDDQNGNQNTVVLGLDNTDIWK